MKGVMSMRFYKAGLAPPIRPITIQTAILRFAFATSNASMIGWGDFQVKKVV
jgi:hypothetical protein